MHTMTDIPRTSESLSHPEMKFTPDDLIKKLESAALGTVDQKESDGHKKVIARIKELQAGTNGVTEKWWKELRDNLSDADKNLASAVSGGNEDITKKLGIETALDAAKKGVDASVKKATEKAEQAKKAIENGDVTAGAAAVGVVMTKKTEGIIKRFSEAEGIEKLDVIREAGASIMEKILFALILSFLSFDSSKIKDAWGNLLGIPKEVQEAGKKGGEIIGKGKNEVGNIDKLQETVSKKKQAFMDKLSKEWGVNFKDSEKAQKFGKVWDKYSTTIDANAKNIIGSYKDGETVYLLDGAILGGKASLNFMFDLVSEGIIPKEAIAMQIKTGTDHIIQFGIATGRSLLGFGRSELDQIFGEISIEELGQDYSNLSPQQKEVLGYTIYHRFGITTYLAGVFAG